MVGAPGREIKSGKKWRFFSIASTPEEGIIRIATVLRQPVSSYTQQLQQLSMGDEVKMRGPFGWFYRKDDSTPVITVAGGIGITPIMAMIKQYQDDPTDSPVHVIYSSSDGYLFKDQLDQAADSSPKLSIHYVKSRDQVQASLAELSAEYDGEAYFYISGAPTMIKALTKTTKDMGVKKSKIIADPYVGY